MPFVRLVIEELHCPRCNAIAQRRIVAEHGNDCIVYIVCSKCKLNQYSGITTRKAITLMMKEKILVKDLEEANSEQARIRLRGRLKRIRDQITRANLGIGG